MSVEEFESTLHGGLTSYFCLIEACVPHIKRIGKGIDCIYKETLKIL